MSAPAPDPSGRPRSDFRLRSASALVLMALALVALWSGGLVFAGFVALAAGLVMLEWTGMAGSAPSRAAGPGGIVTVMVSTFAAAWDPLASLGALGSVAVVGLLAAAIDRRYRWFGLGVLYAGLPGVAAVVLRGPGGVGDLSTGLVALVFVFAVVWGTDTGAYLAGRRIGGPKLWPRVSPKKTWSGALGGLAVALAVGAAVAVWQGQPPGALAAVAALLCVVSQAGDLAESAMKRHFGVKDSGWIIPGHGGVMDRVDGLSVALVLAAVIGAARAGIGEAGAGLLIW